MRLHKINRKQLLKIRFGNPFCEARKCYVVHNIVGYIAEQCYTLTLEHRLKLIDEGEWPCSRAQREVYIKQNFYTAHRTHYVISLFLYVQFMYHVKMLKRAVWWFQVVEDIQQRGSGQSECFYLATINVIHPYAWRVTFYGFVTTLFVTFTSQNCGRN